MRKLLVIVNYKYQCARRTTVAPTCCGPSNFGNANNTSRNDRCKQRSHKVTSRPQSFTYASQRLR